jgi:hypothetical protein
LSTQHNRRQCQEVESNQFLVDGTICLNSETSPQVPIEETHHFIRFRKGYAVSLIRKKYKRELNRSKFEAAINLKKSNSMDQRNSEFVETRCERQTFNHDFKVDVPCAAA